MSQVETDVEKYWDTYLLHCRAEGVKRPNYSDFMVWAEENVPEVQYEED